MVDRYTNDGGPSLLVLGGLALGGFLLYEWWINNQAAASAVAIPSTSNTTTAIQTATTTNPDLQYAISPTDLQNIYAIGVAQTGITNGTGNAYQWRQAYALYKGIGAASGPDWNSIIQDVYAAGDAWSVQRTGSEFANAVNGWINKQGLSGLGTIGANYGPPPQIGLAANRFQIINAWGRS